MPSRERRPRPFRVAFIYEYAPSSDWMMSSLIEAIRYKLPALRAIPINGLFKTYRPGGFRPQRLINLVWVYFRVATCVLFSRPDAMLVRTTPPGVQLWTAWCARLRGIPAICWLMDYHPEIEARRFERCGYSRIAGLLRRLDAAMMHHFRIIVVLDPAMKALVCSRSPAAEVFQHPTWTTNVNAALLPVSYGPGECNKILRLAYSGNLGPAHDLTSFRRLLAELVQRRSVQLFVVGSSASGEARFKKLAEEFGIILEIHPRIAFTQLRDLYEKWRIDAGVVVLAAESAGLVSPSKFSGYINFGIPLIYMGPPGTNTEEVCTRFNGGFWISEKASSPEIIAIADALLDPPRMAAAAAGACAAATHFATLNHETLAELLRPRLERIANGLPPKR